MSGPCTPLGTRTTVLQLCKPVSGEVGWDTSVNGNMDVVDGLFFTLNAQPTLKQLYGGTGVDTSTAPNGTLLIGNGAGLSKATLAVGAFASLTVVNAAGTITLDAIQDIRTAASPSFTGLTVVTGKPFTQFIPAQAFQVTSTTTLPIMVRFGANNYGLSRTAGGAETINYSVTIPVPMSATALKGMRLDSFSIVQQITVATLTSNSTPTLQTTTYVNNSVNSVAAYGGGFTGTAMPTATQANPYVTAETVTTPTFITTAATQLSLDWTAVMQNTGVYAVYGVIVNWTAASL